jgi:tetratricopeptide (TPR) repeat protein
MGKRNEDIYYNRGNIYDINGQYDLAINDFNQIIRINPQYMDAYNRRCIVYDKRGNSYMNKGQYDLAIEDFTRVIEIYPQSADVHFNRGISYLSKGQNDLAIADFTIAKEIDPIKYEVVSAVLVGFYNERGKSYIGKGPYDLAIAAYTRVIENYPRNTVAYYNRGNLYLNKGNYDLAIADYNKVIEINKPKTETKVTTDRVYKKRKDKKPTEIKRSYVVITYPDKGLLVAAYNKRGESYEKKGQYKLALADYDKSLELEPQYEPAKNNREKVLQRL